MTTPRVTVPVEPYMGSPEVLAGMTQAIVKADAEFGHELSAYRYRTLAQAAFDTVFVGLSAAPAPEGGSVDGPEDDELPGDFLARVGMDGALWADGFRKMALKLGYSDMDEGWLIGWFCNAVMAGYDHAQRRFDPALATREEAPAGDRETLRVMLDNLVIAQSLSKELRQRATDEARSYLSALRVQPQASANDQLTADEAWSDLLDKDDRTSPEDQPGMCLITAGELADYMARARPQPVALPLEDAPRDGTMLRLRVRYEAANQDEAWTPLEDSEESWTIGFNNFDNTGDDRWQFVGWDWSQDHLLEATGGAVIGWLPFHTHPAPAPEGGAVDGWRAIDSAPIGELVQVYWPCMALNDDGELTGEMLDREGHVSLSFRHSEKHGWEPDSVIEANGDWFGDDFEFGQPTHWKPRPSRPCTALATREEAPAEAGERETLRVLLDNMVIAQSLSKELRQRATDEARSYLYDLRAQPPAREDGDDRPIEASWTDGVTHAYVNLSAALSAERQAWRQKLGIRIASVRYLDVEVPPAREDAQPVAKVVRLGFSKGGISFTSAGNEADLPDGTPLFTHPAPDALRVAVEALEAITDLSVNLRQGGPDSSDLNDLSDALNTAVDVAHEALAALQAEQKGGA